MARAEGRVSANRKHVRCWRSCGCPPARAIAGGAALPTAPQQSNLHIVQPYIKPEVPRGVPREMHTVEENVAHLEAPFEMEPGGPPAGSPAGWQVEALAVPALVQRRRRAPERPHIPQ